MENNNYLQEVRDQYEDYPYPARNPASEKGFLYGDHASSLNCINHYCFEGQRDFHDNFRVLVAGGGTGDAAIFLAEQLKDTSAEVVYLDMSLSSMAVAKERAKIRKLNNIQWYHDSLLNLSQLDLGQFDYISCTGVLHHLEDPSAGLASLNSVLKDDGSIFIMLYGTYGRSSVYQMQSLMQMINNESDSSQDKINNTRSIINGLPETNDFFTKKSLFETDLSSDIGLYDLLLHSHDRSYTVGELFDFVEDESLTVDYMFETDHPLGEFIFEPETFIQDQNLLSRIKQLSLKEQYSITELIFGQRSKQCCYISRKGKRPADVEDFNLVPVHSVIGQNHNKFVELKKAFDGEGVKIPISSLVSIQRWKYSKSLFNFVDGQRSISEIIELIKQDHPDEDFENIRLQFISMFKPLNKLKLMYLKRKSVPDYPDMGLMQNRMIQEYGPEACFKSFQEFSGK